MFRSHWLLRLVSRCFRRPVGRRRRPGPLATGTFLVERLEERAMLTDFVVNTIVDDDDNGDPTSLTLREAILAANTNASVDGSPAGSLDGDRIFFDSAVFGGAGATISMATGTRNEFVIADDLVIDGVTGTGGGSTSVTIVGTNGLSRDRIFSIDTTGAPGLIDVTLIGMTLEGGDGTGDLNSGRGGAINITTGEDVSLHGTVLRGNSAVSGLDGGAIYNDGSTLRLIDVTIGGTSAAAGNTADNGGGVYNNGGTVVVRGSTIAFNTATANVNDNVDGGGGLYNNGGTLVVDASTIADNDAFDGGGVFNNGGVLVVSDSTAADNEAFDDGGGLFAIDGATTTIVNSTFSGNQAADNGGGLVTFNSTADIRSSTFAANFAGDQGGAIWGNVTIANSIIGDQPGGTSDQSNSAGFSGPDIFGVTTSNGFNIVADAAFGFTNSQPTDQVGGDPDLAPLADNGGPTLTHLPAIGGDADETGEANLQFDQRGVRRQAGPDDIGAVEIELVVDSTGDGSDGDFSPGNFTLREAIELANARPGKDVILFDPTVFPDRTRTTIALSGTQFVLSDDVEIVGLGWSRIRIDARSLSRHFTVANSVATISGVALVRGVADKGGAILVLGNGTLDLLDSYLRDNRGTLGGAVHAAGTANVEIVRSSLNFNVATDKGGAVLGGAGSVILLRDSTLYANTAARAGGLYEVQAANVVVQNSTISRNTANVAGGVNARAGSITFLNSSVVDNRGLVAGGGVFLQAGVQTIAVNSLFIGNRIVNTGLAADILGILQFGGVVARFSAYNLVGTANFTGGIQNGTAGNKTGFNILNVVDNVARNNGGETLTHLLVEGGPAVDAGNPAFVPSPDTDQRGRARVVNGVLDVGALELDLV